jgi:hypothetical protein
LFAGGSACAAVLLEHFWLDSAEEKALVQRQVRRDEIVTWVYRSSKAILGRARLREHDAKERRPSHTV